MNWMPISGRMSVEDGVLTFQGSEQEHQGQILAATGNFICDQSFSGGQISADVTFPEVDAKSACDIIFYYDKSIQQTFNAGISNELLYGIRSFRSKWDHYAVGGDVEALEAGREYHLDVDVKGSQVTLSIDGVEVIAAEIPVYLPQSQVGIFCMGYHDIKVRNFTVTTEPPRAFVVMQFSSPYNEVYSEVIQRVCEEEGISVLRIDEQSGPGLIIADISRAIRESRLIIADISPQNPNVFYEVGYAHALNKPTILMAEKGTTLPFDVSAFRTLFYDNSISGKSKLEDGLRKHIRASLTERKG
ncbi:hypothetical protein [Aeoliella mucimassa]|uniref:Nucleoside 2-deoxyribosyltransferase n=1 Tax=Aeoliella mucimassa TaxID=2527972 RepID=A0A518AVT9_9BACT|nr:hypothetical protein [Aeoliella mucimassa]QDU58822.1 hypothetical protein Pan181_50620 [Aeoliella mucimassa]